MELKEKIKFVKIKIEDLQELFYLVKVENRKSISKQIFKLQDELEDLLLNEKVV